jgi:hypothetical protein
MHRTILKTIFEPFVIAAATIYFVVDALVLSILKPLLRQFAKLKFFQFIAWWIASLGPYPTLALFVIPLALLEPVKPLSAYLIASGHFTNGMLVLAVGEVLKITLVERIFYIGRDKLMTIKAFAWAYSFVLGWLTWAQALPPWQAVKRRVTYFILWAQNQNPRLSAVTPKADKRERGWIVRFVPITDIERPVANERGRQLRSLFD